MKNVLFVLQGIGYGGSMTSLINLLRFLKEKHVFNIDILFMDRYGELLDEAKVVGKVLREDKLLQAVTPTRSKLVRLRRYDLLAIRAVMKICATVFHTTTSEFAYRIAAKKYSQKYECVVAYQESIATTFSTYIDCGRRLAWVHNGYENVKRICGSAENLKKIYGKFDRVICVSRAGMNAFRNLSGLKSEKIDYIYNTVDIEQIVMKATAKLQVSLSNSENISQVERILSKRERTVFISVGRCVEQKRFDKIIDVAKHLKNAGYSFGWIIVGSGELYERLRDDIYREKLENEVVLTGGLNNPFPVMKASDIVVVTSDFEAQPMVVNEALLLGKPVITTNYESAEEVVKHGINGIICGMSSEQIYLACRELLDNPQKLKRLSRGAGSFHYNNNAITQKVIYAIEGSK